MLIATCMVAATPAFSVPLVDGVLSAGEYDTLISAGWYNGHNTDGSQYQKSDSLETDVWYTSTNSFFYLYIEAPVEVKNTIWGTGFTDAEAMEYYQHWCSPNDGNPAALDGTNCAHHDNGYAHFLAEKTDYGTMTGSEKVIFGGGYKADLAGSADGSLLGNSLLDYFDSVDYVIASLGCDTTDCDAHTTPMSFEFKFAHFSDTDIGLLLASMASGSDELEFHLSPEWGGSPASVPEPGTLLLLGLGLVGFGFSRRKLV